MFVPSRRVVIVWGPFTCMTSCWYRATAGCGRRVAAGLPSHNPLLLQHHPRWVWSWPFLPGPVAGRPRQALQLWRPGHMDADRCLTDWRWLRGTSRRLFVHLAKVMCFREERCFEVSLPVGVDVLWLMYLYVFNVQHLYFACLDEGKIKQNKTKNHACLQFVFICLKFIFFCEKLKLTHRFFLAFWLRSGVKTMNLFKLEQNCSDWKSA